MPTNLKQGKETEHNWAARERSIICIRGMLKGEAHVRYMDSFLAGLKNGMLDASFKTVCLGPDHNNFVLTLL